MPCSTSQYSYRKEAKYCATEGIKKFGIALTSQTHLQEIKLLLNQNEIKEIVFVITVKKVFKRPLYGLYVNVSSIILQTIKLNKFADI